MKIQISVVGVSYSPRPEVTWPEDWPIPRVGDEIATIDHNFCVRTVIYYPQGSENDDPFVYVVVGTSPRP